MHTSDLIHVIYASSATADVGPSELESILLHSRVNNAARSISGVLLYSAGSFFQVLEGPEPELIELYDRIAADSRHKHVTRIIQEPVAERAFGDWRMGCYAPADATELEAIDGLDGFFAEGNRLTDLRPGRAKKLLAAFAQGRWRSRVEDRSR